MYIYIYIERFIFTYVYIYMSLTVLWRLSFAHRYPFWMVREGG